MSSWWMVESEDDRVERDRVLSRAVAPPENDARRHTVYKRPDGKDVDAIAGHAYGPFLAGPPALAGSLDKLSKRKTWQRRYWELRGPWLMYWSSSTTVLQRMRQRIARGRGRGGDEEQEDAAVPNPLGVVDLARISHAARADDDLQVVHLVTFSGHVIDLRAPKESDKAAAAEPSVDEWRASLDKAIAEAHETANEVNDVEGADALGESTNHTGGAADDDDDFQRFQNRLEQFYREHAKDKLSQVPLLVDKFKGREAQLFNVLNLKYLPNGRGGGGGGGGDDNDRDEPEDLLLSARTRVKTEPRGRGESSANTSTAGVEMTEATGAAGAEMTTNPMADGPEEDDDEEGGSHHKFLVVDEEEVGIPMSLRVCLVLLGVQRGEEYFHLPKCFGGAQNPWARQCSVVYLWTARLCWAAMSAYLVVANYYYQVFTVKPKVLENHLVLGIEKCQYKATNDDQSYPQASLYPAMRNYFHDDDDDVDEDDFFGNKVRRVKYGEDDATAKWVLLSVTQYSDKGLCKMGNLVGTFVTLSVFGIECLGCYLWIMMNAHNPRAMFRTHGRKMVSVIDYWAPKAYVYAAVTTLIAILCAVPSQVVNHRDVDDGDYVNDDAQSYSIAGDVTFNLFTNLMYGAATFPALMVILLFFVESKRLEFVTDDFIELMARASGNFHGVLGPAYMELLDEWAHTQGLYEGVGTLILICTAIVIVCLAIINVVQANQGFYFEALYSDSEKNEVLGLDDEIGQKTAEQLWLGVLGLGIYILTFGVPYIIYLFAIDRINRVADNLRDKIVLSLLEDDGATQAAFKLIKLNETNEPGITLLGRRISACDIAFSIISAAGFQLIVAVYGGAGE